MLSGRRSFDAHGPEGRWNPPTPRCLRSPAIFIKSFLLDTTTPISLLYCIVEPYNVRPDRTRISRIRGRPGRIVLLRYLRKSAFFRPTDLRNLRTRFAPFSPLAQRLLSTTTLATSRFLQNYRLCAVHFTRILLFTAFRVYSVSPAAIDPIHPHEDPSEGSLTRTLLEIRGWYSRSKDPEAIDRIRSGLPNPPGSLTRSRNFEGTREAFSTTDRSVHGSLTETQTRHLRKTFRAGDTRRSTRAFCATYRSPYREAGHSVPGRNPCEPIVIVTPEVRNQGGPERDPLGTLPPHRPFPSHVSRTHPRFPSEIPSFPIFKIG